MRERLASPIRRRDNDPRVAAILDLAHVGCEVGTSPADVAFYLLGCLVLDVDLDRLAKRARQQLGELVAFAFADSVAAQ